MKLSEITDYIKKLVKDFWISLRWNEEVEYEVRYRIISELPKMIKKYEAKFPFLAVTPFKIKRREVIIKKASVDEIKILLRTQRAKEDFMDYKTRLKSNHICFIVKFKGTNDFIGYMWIGLNKYHFTQHLLKIKFEKNNIYLYNLYIFPKFRGKGVAPRLLKAVSEYLIAQNYERAYALVSKTNPGMMQYALPKYRKGRKRGTHYFKYLKPIRAKSRNPFLQYLYELYYQLRYFKDYYSIGFEG